jgi:(2Fe-2S) ferredoxin
MRWLQVDPKGRVNPGYRMHAFVCGHSRPEGSTRGCCSEKGSLELMKQFKLATKESGINDVRVQKSGCLDFCESGPTCVIYPGGDWFRITEESIPSLVKFLDGGTLPSEFALDLKA